jgi:1-deoxy-D-xylulose-5-phosphate reductoisomerase
MNISPAPRKRVVLLGATGSIGESTLRVIAAHPDKLELVAVAARGNWEKLAAIASAHGVRHVGLFDEKAFAAARAHPAAFPAGTRLVGGLAGLVELAQLPAGRYRPRRRRGHHRPRTRPRRA